MAWTTLCDESELPTGRGLYAEVDGFQLGVYRDDGQVYVLDATCPHAGANLSGGAIREGCIVCPRHGWAFELRTGNLRGGTGAAVRTYPTRRVPRDDRVLIQADLPIY